MKEFDRLQRTRDDDRDRARELIKADAGAIGFYDDEGNQLSQEEFEALFANSDGEDE